MFVISDLLPFKGVFESSKAKMSKFIVALLIYKRADYY